MIEKDQLIFCVLIAEANDQILPTSHHVVQNKLWAIKGGHWYLNHLSKLEISTYVYWMYIFGKRIFLLDFSCVSKCTA
jgi:hypothetical protein